MATQAWFTQACVGYSSNNLLPGATIPARIASQFSALWESGATVNYYYLNGTDVQKTKVDAAIQAFVPYINLTFHPVTDASTAQIRIRFSTQGSGSIIGNGALDLPEVALSTMEFDTIDAVNTTLSPTERAKILHQFGHALGLVHEHLSPTSTNGVAMSPIGAEMLYESVLGFSKAQVDAQIINFYNTNTISNFGHVDVTSIMLYPMPAQLNTQGVDISYNLDLNEQDKAFLVACYTRDAPHPLALNWVLSHALDVLGITGVNKIAILTATTPGARRQELQNAIVALRSA